MAMIQCAHCGKDISDRAKACPGCGQPVVTEPPVVETKLLLCEECLCVLL